ncbi:hypothetical protein Tco_1371729 [Tanacetum coccineum]
MPVDQLMEEFDMVTAQQAALVAQLRARFSSERSQSVQKDEEMLQLKTQSAIAECRWLISHGLRLAAMSTLESQEVKQSFEDVVKCALARGKAEAMEELHEKRLLTVPAAQVPGYNDNAYEELVAAMEAMKLLELPHHVVVGSSLTDGANLLIQKLDNP